MDQAPKLEVEKPIENMRDLFHLSPEEKDELRKMLENSKGLVRIFVHPLFEKWRYGQNESYKDHPYQDDLIKIENVLTTLINKDQGTPPLIIMEEYGYLPELNRWLKKKSNESLRKRIYIVNTFLNSPTPKRDRPLTEKEHIQSMFDPYNDPNWKALENTLKEVGVQKILLGGMQFKMSEHKKDWTYKDPWMGYCVGIAMSHLSKDKGGNFEVELSALTAPFSERRNFADFKRKNQE